MIKKFQKMIYLVINIDNDLDYDEDLPKIEDIPF